MKMKRHTIRIATFLCALWLALAAEAQERIAFDALTTEHGLSRSNVKDIVQDGKGFVWIGTGGGLNRYDGQSITVYRYDPSDSTTISDDAIRSMAVDRAGNLWVGTGYGGLNLYQHSQDNFVRFTYNEADPSAGLTANEIDHVMEDRDGFIWLSTTNGITRYQPSSGKFLQIWERPNNPHALPNRYVKHIFQRANGELWAAHDRGISKMTPIGADSVLFENYRYEEGRAGWLPSQYCKRILEDAQGQLWVASDGGVSRFEQGQNRFVTYSHQPADPRSLSNNYVKTMALDGRGRIWVGADAGVSIFDPALDGFLQYRHDVNDHKSLSNDYVKGIYCDQTGTMWVGTDAGVNIYDPAKYPFTLYQHENGNPNSLSSGCVYAIHEDADGWVWLGTTRGLNKLHRPTNRMKAYQYRPDQPGGLPSDIVKCVFRDSQGILWVGTDNGLCRLVKENPDGTATFKRYGHEPGNPNSLSNNSIVSVMEDRKGRLWIGTFGNGLNRYSREDDAFQQMNKDNSIDGINLWDSQVQFLLLDSRNTLWLGTAELDTLNFSAGLMGNFSKSKQYNEMRQNTRAYSICETRNGLIWLGTGNGLIKYDPRDASLVNFTIADGLPSNTIQAVVEDHSGVLWISTDKGISRFDYANRKSHNFDHNDGLQGPEFNNMAVFRNGKGEIYFGGLRGLNVFQPEALRLNERVPEVYITGLYIKNKPITPHNSPLLDRHIMETPVLELPYDENFIKLEFVALNFRNAHKNQYAYRMKGLQEEWVYTSAQRRDATFTSMRPGTYVFQVKASNNDGLWNEEGATLTIIIHPPWWETLWARGIFLSAFLLGIYAFFRVRTNMLEAQKRELKRLVDERTEELTQANATLQERQEEIIVQNEELQQQAEEIAAQRDRIEEQHQALEASYNDIRIVSEVGKDITGSLSLERIFDEVYKDVNMLMSAPTFGIGVFNELKSALDFIEIDGDGQELGYSQDGLDAKQLLSVKCFETGKSIVINEFSKEFPDYVRDPNSQMPINESVVYLPLVSKGKRMGVITVQSRKQQAYQQRHITILEMLASYAATALDNSDAYEVIKNKNRLITDSIRYAQTIQQAILPMRERLDEAFREHFVIYRPKDIVSGDFYWHLSLVDPETHLRKQYLACVDCTGHGVPGAFMSMIGTRILNEVVFEKGLRVPAEILELIDQSVRVALRQEGVEAPQEREGSAVNDGMDMSLCVIEPMGLGKSKITFAGAKSSIFYTKDQVLYRMQGDKRSIGGLQLRTSPFQNFEVMLGEGDCLYLSTDGIMDQHGPPDSKKFGRAYFMEILQRHVLQPMALQGELLEQALDAHQQSVEQRDDITVLGIRL
jgi:ligand-binding sensor domain-containing protein/serine phosphatase RsbU (regulator of sigma subunit)